MDMTVEITGSEELQKSLEEAIRRYPDLAEKRIRMAGLKFKRDVVKKTKDVTRTRKGKLLKGYKVSKVQGYGKDMHVDFMATAPHFHLVEHGHVQYSRNGKPRKPVGFTPGKHMVKQTVEGFGPEMEKRMTELRDDILRESGLT